MIQLDTFKVMLVLSHSENTFDKKAMRDKPNPFIKETGMTMKAFIKSAALRNFYSTA
jgi:hypothetical protein